MRQKQNPSEIPTYPYAPCQKWLVSIGDNLTPKDFFNIFIEKEE